MVSIDEIVSAVVGFVLGGLVMAVWTALGRWLREDRFWPLFRQISRDLAAGVSPERFLQQYAHLLKVLAAYLGKTTVRVGIAILPVVVSYALFAPIMSSRAMHSAERLEIYPPQGAVVTLGGRSLAFGTDGRAELRPGQLDAPATFVLGNCSIELPRLNGPIAVTNSPWKCLGLQLVGLKTHHQPDGPPLFILRPDLADNNPVYPYLSDVEFWFWAGLVCASLVVGLVLQVKR
jgi:hypothetical protein